MGNFEKLVFMCQPLICLLLLGIRVMILKWIFRQGLTCGMDYNRYPRSRSFVLGTNITF